MALSGSDFGGGFDFSSLASLQKLEQVDGQLGRLEKRLTDIHEKLVNVHTRAVEEWDQTLDAFRGQFQ